ncbi:MlaD family protein [Chitinivibrio alkaliphilus]|uniref:ABC transport system periplasmic substrate binding protein n=1 Tax=Chitinivibrio alkaliphilus ACht1 TaxID=1313304 RepID=U7DAR1_9BACT|nr:MlaD family protein [Chitinivibrio alkaliphilus]ERP31485.1 ABC transport system periplasmic substrate binding protein [Chitinivibrio alkaliphilus ACht1]
MAITALQKMRLILFIVLMGIVALVFIGIALGSRFVTDYTTYYAYFEGESLSGLSRGASLQFYGIPIGYIEDISYNVEDLSRLKVEIKVQEDFPVRSDMKAQTVVEGITGKKHVNLVGGSDPSATRLSPGEYIPTEQSIMSLFTNHAEELLEQVNVTVGNINEVITNIERLTGDESAVVNILKNTEEITMAINTVTDSVGAMARSIQSTLAHTEEIAMKVDAMVGTVTEETDIAGLMNNVDGALVAMRDVAEKFSMTAEQSREDISEITRSFRDASVNINILSQQLRDNPSLILRGRNIQRREIN